MKPASLRHPIADHGRHGWPPFIRPRGDAVADDEFVVESKGEEERGEKGKSREKGMGVDDVTGSKGG